MNVVKKGVIVGNRSPSANRQGYVFDRTYLRLDLYRLLAYVFASKRLYGLSTGGADDLFEGLLVSCEDMEIERALISSAITIRMLLERTLPGRSKMGKHYCGRLEQNQNGHKVEKRLSIREACNKIIHSKDELFEVDDEHDVGELLPIITLKGIRGVESWTAHLDLVEYVRCGLTLDGVLAQAV